MALRIAVDANCYVDFCRGEPAAVEVLRRAAEIYIPFIVLAELRAGFVLGTRHRDNERQLIRFLQSRRVLTLLPDEATTHVYAKLFSDLRRAGTPIPVNDLWIATLALQHDLTLATRDRHFDVVPGLSRI